MPDDIAEILDCIQMQAEDHGIVPAADVLPLVAAAREVLRLAGELDVEDGYTPEPDALRRPVSRGDRIRAAVSRHLTGEQHT